MELLGKYPSTIDSYIYSSLLKLFTSNVSSKGDNGGVLNISSANILTLVNEADTTSSLPIPSFNSRSNEEQINYPIDLLTAKYAAIQNELNSFTDNSEILISRLQAEAILLDKLLYQAKLNYWVSTLYPVLDAQVFSWDFNQGMGLLSSNVGVVNPANGGSYDQNINVQKLFNVSTGLTEGLIPSGTQTTVPCINLSWTYNGSGVAETISSNSSTQIDILENTTQIQYSPTLIPTVLLPEGVAESSIFPGIFSITGNTSSGPISTYIRTGFYPRENQEQLTPYNAIPNTLFTTGWTNTGWSITSGVATSGSGSLISPLFVDTSENPLKVSAGQTVYVSATIKGNIGAAPMQPNLLLINSSGTTIETIALALPVANGEQYNWYYTLQLPSNVITDTMKLEFVTTDTNWTVSSPVVQVPIPIGLYQIDPSTVSVFTIINTGRIGNVFNSFSDYVLGPNNSITFVGLPIGDEVYVRWTEFYPYYQCSVNNINWSPIVMLDPSRPYIDESTTINHLVKTVGNSFPITDERGYPSGLYIQMTGVPTSAYLIQVSVTALPNWGETATLEMDMTTTGYLNGIHVSPFVDFPLNVTKVELEGFESSTRVTIYQGSFEIDTDTTITFPTQLVKKAYLTFTQPGYTPVDNEVGGLSFIRRKVLQQIQNILPLNAQRTFPVTYQGQSGFQYSLGVENVYGVNNEFNPASVTVSGPFLIHGCPETITYNSVTSGSPMQYLCYQAYSSEGALIESNTTGVLLTSGNTIVMPFTSGLNRAIVTMVNLYIKSVLVYTPSETDIISRYCLQVTKR
jgi:hypothetical protein